VDLYPRRRVSKCRGCVLRCPGKAAMDCARRIELGRWSGSQLSSYRAHELSYRGRTPSAATREVERRLCLVGCAADIRRLAERARRLFSPSLDRPRSDARSQPTSRRGCAPFLPKSVKRQLATAAEWLRRRLNRRATVHPGAPIANAYLTDSDLGLPSPYDASETPGHRRGHDSPPTQNSITGHDRAPMWHPLRAAERAGAPAVLIEDLYSRGAVPVCRQEFDFSAIIARPEAFSPGQCQTL
jgi:hypothetical protein